MSGCSPSIMGRASATVAQDMFGIMRAAFNLQRLFVLQRARLGEGNLPPILTPREVLEFATIEGARALRPSIGVVPLSATRGDGGSHAMCPV